MRLKKSIFAAILLSMALALPFVTGGIPIIGESLSPMHFPILISGFLLGPIWGGALGLIAPIIRNLLFGMPSPIYPKAIRMAIELCAYGISSGLLYALLPKKKINVYTSLIAAMAIGRIFYVLSCFVFSLVDTKLDFYLPAVLIHSVSSTAFGIIFQIILIPPIIYALKKAKYME